MLHCRNKVGFATSRLATLPVTATRVTSCPDPLSRSTRHWRNRLSSGSSNNNGSNSSRADDGGDWCSENELAKGEPEYGPDGEEETDLSQQSQQPGPDIADWPQHSQQAGPDIQMPDPNFSVEHPMCDLPTDIRNDQGSEEDCEEDCDGDCNQSIYGSSGELREWKFSIGKYPESVMQHLCYEEDFDAECDQSSHGSDEEEQFLDTPQQVTFEHLDPISEAAFLDQICGPRDAMLLRNEQFLSEYEEQRQNQLQYNNSVNATPISGEQQIVLQALHERQDLQRIYNTTTVTATQKRPDLQSSSSPEVGTPFFSCRTQPLTQQMSSDSELNRHREELTSRPIPTVTDKLPGPRKPHSSAEFFREHAAPRQAEYERRRDELYRKLDAQIKEEEEKYVREWNSKQQVSIANCSKAAMPQRTSTREPLDSHHTMKPSKTRTAAPSQPQSVSRVAQTTVAEHGSSSSSQTRSEPQQSILLNETDLEDPVRSLAKHSTPERHDRVPRSLQRLATVDPQLVEFILQYRASVTYNLDHEEKMNEEWNAIMEAMAGTLSAQSLSHLSTLGYGEPHTVDSRLRETKIRLSGPRVAEASQAVQPVPTRCPTAVRTSERPAPTLLQAPLKTDSNSAATPESESNSVRQPVDFNSNSTQTQNRTIGDCEQTCTFNRLRKEIKAAVKLQPAEFDEGVEKNKERASNTAESGTRQSSGHPGAAREGPGPKANRSRSRPFKQQTCYNCGQPGHFKAACTAKKRPSKCGPTCGLCGDKHSTDRCPQLGAASRFVRQSAAGPSTSNVAKAESKADASSRKPFPVTDATKFVVDDLMEVEDAAQAPKPQVLDPATPAVPTPNTSRIKLFFVESMVQSTPMWILADSGSSRNLISEITFSRLPFQPPLRPHGDVRVIGSSGEALHLKGFAVLPISFGSTLVWHEFGVVKDLLLEMLIGGDVFIPHFCTLQYLKNGKKQLEFGLQTCSECEHNRSDPESGAAVQLRYVDQELKRKQNRVKLKQNFVAVLPDKQSMAAPEATRALETHYSTASQQVPDPAVNQVPDPPEAGPDPSVKQVPDPHREKLQKVLLELPVANLLVDEDVRNQLIEILRQQLDAFAATLTYLGRTSVIVQCIKTGDAQPF